MSVVSGSTRTILGFAAAKTLMRDYLGRTVCATGKDIASATKQNMYPGHFEDTSLSKDNTEWEQLSELAGQVHIPTEYAALPEYGTVDMAPRPALTPAIAQEWPASAHRNWDRAPTLPRADSPGPPGPVLSR